MTYSVCLPVCLSVCIYVCLSRSCFIWLYINDALYICVFKTATINKNKDEKKNKQKFKSKLNVKDGPSSSAKHPLPCYVCHQVNQVNGILIWSNEIPSHQLIIYDIEVGEWTGMKNVGGKSHTIMTMRVINIPSQCNCDMGARAQTMESLRWHAAEMATMSDAISASFFLVRPNPNFNRDRFRPFRQGGSRVQHVPV